MSESPDFHIHGDAGSVDINSTDHSISFAQGARYNQITQFFITINTGNYHQPEPTRDSAGQNPYMGLLPFTTESAAWYFGRETEIEELDCRLVELAESSRPKILPLYGPSGSGKSSLAMAGLLPAIAKREEGDARQTLAITFRPGVRPLESIASALALAANPKADDVLDRATRFHEALQKPDARLRWLVDNTPTLKQSRLLLVVDQWEELYQAETPEQDAKAFISKLLDWVHEPDGPTLVLTLNSGFLDRTQSEPRLGQALQQGLLISCMSAEGLHRAITEPARMVNQREGSTPFSETLVAHLINEARNREGALPLLQFALKHAYEAYRSGKDPAAALEEIGGLAGAFNTTVDQIFLEIPEEARPLIKRAFFRMTALGGESTSRRRALLSEIVWEDGDRDAAKAHLSRFARRDVRLIMMAHKDGDVSLELTHESALTHWRRLADWIQTWREEWVFRGRLDATVRAWEQQERPRDSLYRGTDLVLLRDYGDKYPELLSRLDREFTQAAILLENRARWLRMFQAGFVAVGLVIAVQAWRANSESVRAKRGRELAQFESEQARTQRDLAMEALDKTTYDFQEKLMREFPHTRPLVVELLADTEAFFTRIHEVSGAEDAKVEWKLASNRLSRGDLMLELGQTQEAGREYAAAFALLKPLAERAPEDVDKQRYLSFALKNMGVVSLIMNQSDKTLEYFTQALEVCQALAEADPKNQLAQRDLSVSYSNLGDIYLLLNQSEKALDYYTKALEVRQTLAEGDPKNQETQRDLSVSYGNLGDVHLRLNQSEKALEYFAQALEVRQALAEADPKNQEAQRDLSVSYGNLGDVHLRLNQSEKALEYFTQALKVRKALAEADPKNQEAQRDLSVSYGNLGDVYLRLNQSEKALEYFTQALKVRKALAEADPKDQEAQRDLSVSYGNLGDIYLRLNQPEKALEYFTQALEVRQALAGDDPKNHMAQLGLSVSYGNLGDVYLGLNQSEKALEYFTQALEVRQALAEADPRNLLAQQWLFISYIQLGGLEIEQSNFEKARDYFQRGLPIAKALADGDPNNPDHQKRLKLVQDVLALFD